jgi:hypothetical protein
MYFLFILYLFAYILDDVHHWFHFKRRLCHLNVKRRVPLVEQELRTFRVLNTGVKATSHIMLLDVPHDLVVNFPLQYINI